MFRGQALRQAGFAGLFAISLIFASAVMGAYSANAAGVNDAALRAMGIDPAAADPLLIQRLSGGCDTNPYPELEKYNRGAQITPRVGSGTSMGQGINSVLACRLLKFLKYAESGSGKSCRFNLASGYRSAQQQANMCGSGGDGCAAAGKSCHQYGLAVDITGTAACVSWARQYLGQRSNTPGAQQFKLHFPYAGDHLQCSENRVAACGPTTQGCDGTGAAITPDLNFVPRPSASPLQNMMSGLQNLMTPPQAQQCSAGTVLMNGSCVPQQTTQTTNPFDYVTPPPTPTTTSSYISTTTSNTNTIPNPQPTGGNTGPSAIELIGQIANPSSTPSDTLTAKTTNVATSTPVTLNDSIKNGVQLSGGQNPNSISPTSSLALKPGVTQTFVSHDMNQNAQSPVSTSYSSTFAILKNIRLILTNMLLALRPFGGAIPQSRVQATGE